MGRDETASRHARVASGGQRNSSEETSTESYDCVRESTQTWNTDLRAQEKGLQDAMCTVV